MINCLKCLNDLGSNFQVSSFKNFCMFLVQASSSGGRDGWKRKVSFVLFIYFYYLYRLKPRRIWNKELHFQTLITFICHLWFYFIFSRDSLKDLLFSKPWPSEMPYFLFIYLNLKHVTYDQVSSIVVKVIIKCALQCFRNILQTPWFITLYWIIRLFLTTSGFSCC